MADGVEQRRLALKQVCQSLGKTLRPASSAGDAAKESPPLTTMTPTVTRLKPQR